ncbi:leucine-rich PPR motif-containing protein, mitochondrial isoform X2 [Sardina pilchardus]|uniref:leucine-rich PPR motif-containing protein, mitochondrial isoform X2 n=1 Tax=Sardina pilchardus TaxID=27697 RepID=UPI002E158140
MAALLRSARVLKLSPSSLLQVAGVTKHGAPLSRLYSGAIGGRGIGLCTSQGVSRSVSVNRLLWPSVAGVRRYAAAPEQQGMEEGSVALRARQAKHFDWALAKLDSSVRRTGRVTKTLLLNIFHDICRTGNPSGNQALLLLRSCGSLLPEANFTERTELAHRIWDKLQQEGASYDASHYNALLKVYLQNEHKFSPTEFLAKMEGANVQPNRVTYQRLIAAYCQEGDIEGASTILGFMKSKDLPITEAVFNSLLTGHARAGDMESAESILNVMKGAGIEPGPDTFVALMTAFAEKGDIEKIKQTLDMAEGSDASLMDRDLMQVLFSLARAGHAQHVPVIVERMRHERGYVPDAMNLCLSLITQGQEDTAYAVLKTFPRLQEAGQNGEMPDLGNFFLRHCINMDKSLEKLTHYCRDLKDSGLHTRPMQFALFCALDAKKTGLAVELMKVMKDEGLPVRPHFFWPLFAHHQRQKNTPGTMEVIRGMQELDVLPDVETTSQYILPSFPNLDSARSALKEAGCMVANKGFAAAELRAEATKGNLAGILALMSSPTFPSVDLNAFRSALISSFRRSDDVESMAKVTELVYQDKRFCSPPQDPKEYVAYLLYNLIDAMSSSEVQAKEGILRQYFIQLKSLNISIPLSVYRGIRNLLDSYQVPELIKDVLVLVDNKGSVSSTETSASKVEELATLEGRLAELKAEEQPFSRVLKQLITALCTEEKLERALELKTQHEEHMAAGGYAALINLCCRHDNLDEAMNLKREISLKDSTFVLDSSKYMTLLRSLTKHGRREEALELLKEIKEKNVPLKDVSSTLFHTLNGAALKGETDTIRELQDTIFTLGLAKPTANLCSPLITAYLENGDLTGALEACKEYSRQYKQMPRIHDIITGLVEKGETEKLQDAMDFISQERGEMTMLYDLFFAFMQTGRYREARKIIETPGLRARPGRLQWFAEKSIALNQMEILDNLVDLTSKLFECDRDEMYHYILRLCNDTADWRKAEAVWTKMQEENVIPRERTLILLAKILKSNGQEVPFEVPETWYDQGTPTGKASKASPQTSADYQMRVMTLCKKGQAKEAYDVLKTADKMDVTLGPAPFDTLIKALLAAGSLEEAMEIRNIATTRNPDFKMSDVASSLLLVTLVKKDQVKEAKEVLQSILQANQVPSPLAITRLVQGLSSHGDVQGIQEVEEKVKSIGATLNLSSMVFINNTALAHIKNGDIESAVEMLENIYTEGGDASRSVSISFVFRKVLEQKNDQALDKLAVMAEKLANHFASYRAASDLFLQYLDLGLNEEAKFMLARCNAVAEQKDFLMSFVAKASRQPGQAKKITALAEMIPDFTDKDTLWAYLIKCYGMDEDLASAKSLYERAQQEGVQLDELSLKRLALLYRQAGETAPFQEPPETFKFYANKLMEKKKSESAEE